MSADDEKWMKRAFELAARGLGATSPNPAVGSVVVADGKMVAEGYHERFGGPHAEAAALSAAGDRARGATVYVTLEPCRHVGKTAPCTEALAAAGAARVVYCLSDPNPDASGGGEVLAARGVAVEAGVLKEAGKRFYSYYYKHLLRKQPYLCAKWAMTADGRLASRTGDSQWITSDESREQARLLRAESDAVMVGIGTVLRDDPKLTARQGDKREPVRVVVDTSLRMPPAAEMFGVAGGAVIIACAETADPAREEELRKRGADVVRLPVTGGRVRIDAVLDMLYERGKLRILVEGGAMLLGAAFDAKRVDEACVFIAPKVIGGKQAPGAVSGRGITRMRDALALTEAVWETVGPDMKLRGLVGEHDWMD